MEPRNDVEVRKSKHRFRVIKTEADNKLRYAFDLNRPDIRVISFKGGGSRVVVYTKFLEVAHKLGLLETVKEVGGSSSGSIAALFAALHYEDPLQRTAALNAITECDRYDIFTESFGSRFYQVVTFPLYLISKPLEWLGSGISWIAAQCNKILIGKVIGTPLAIVGGIIKLASSLTSPRFYAGLTNLIAKGGVYHGDVVENTLRDLIHKDVHSGLYAILSKMDKADPNRQAMIARIVEIGLGRRENGRLILTTEITFAHLAELSRLTNGKFKEYYCTAVKVSDNSLMVFNAKNSPDCPLYKATRYAITFPGYYQTREWNDEKYIDGGALNNAPVSLATPGEVSEFKSTHGITDNMSRLNVRVEYPQEYKTHLFDKAPPKSWLGKKIHNIVRALAKKLTGGIDVFTTDAEVTETMRKDFAHQTLQLKDYGIGQMEDNVSAKRRAEIDAKVEKSVNRYYENHLHPEVKAGIENYSSPEEMPQDVQRKFLKYLENPANKTADIFQIPGVTAEELDRIRKNEIDVVAQLVARNSESTAVIARTLSLDMERVIIPENHSSHSAPIPAVQEPHGASPDLEGAYFGLRNSGGY